MRRLLRAAIAGALLLAAAVHALGADLFVDATVGNDANDGLRWGTARATVTAAVAAATASPEPDVISVAEGAYPVAAIMIVPADTTLLGGFPSGGGTRNPRSHAAVLDGGGILQVVVYLDGERTVLDGFTVRRGQHGVLAECSTCAIRNNVIEDNGPQRAPLRGAGIWAIVAAAPAQLRIEGNLIRHNDCSHASSSCPDAVRVTAPGVELGTFMSGNVIEDNGTTEFCESDVAGVYVDAASGRIEHCLSRRMLGGNGLTLYGNIELDDVETSGNSRDGIAAELPLRLSNVTVVGNALAIRPACQPNQTLDIVNSIIWANPRGIYLDPLDCSAMSVRLTNTVIQGGWPTGTNVWDVDPLFVPGPLGDYYLSDVAAGQAATSPGVDAGTVTSLVAGLDDRATRIDGVADGAMVDLGHHYLDDYAVSGPGDPPKYTYPIRRSDKASAMAPYRDVDALPFTDDPGTLSNAALPLLFYDVPGSCCLAVRADKASDAVVLYWGP